MMKLRLCTLITLVSVFSSLLASAQFSDKGNAIPYQGRVSVNGQPFTGVGKFKFLLYTRNPLASGPVTGRITGVTILNGRVTGITMSGEGSGYLFPPSVAFSGGGGTGAEARVEINSAGGLESISIVNGGSGYTSAPTAVIADPPREVPILTNSDSSPFSMNEPISFESIQVVDGVFSTLLGRGFPLISERLGRIRDDLFLRVWFDGGLGFQQLFPDSRIGATPLSLISRKVVGIDSEAGGLGASAIGQGARANGSYSLAAGINTEAMGRAAVALGEETSATGFRSVAMGLGASASGNTSRAFGSGVFARGHQSTAIGSGSNAIGGSSTAIGTGLNARSDSEVVVGRYNSDYIPANGFLNPLNRLFVVGNGEDDFNRSSALIIHKDGQATFENTPPSVNGGSPRNHAVSIRSKSNGGDTLALVANAASPVADTNFITFFRNQGAAATDIVGEIQGRTGNGIELVSAGADYAEFLPLIDPLESIAAGDVVGIHAGRISRKTAGADQIMVVSTNPIVVGNRPNASESAMEESHRRVAFIGQVPVRVVGAVKAGDYLFASGAEDGTAVARGAASLKVEQLKNVLGRSWESSDDEGEKLVNAAVGLDLGAALASEVKRQNAELMAQGQLIRDLAERLSRLESVNQTVSNDESR